MAKDTRFKKGNPGKPKGAQNKVNKTLRTMIFDFLEDRWPHIEKDFRRLRPRDRVILFEKLLNYALPKYQNFSLEGMSESDLERFETYLLEKNGRRQTENNFED